MANVLWLIRRFKAMSIPEVVWRLSQKGIQKREEKRFGKNETQVISEVFNRNFFSLQLHPEKLHLNFDNKVYGLNTTIHLLAGADYKDYKKRWSVGFQTENIWPDTFSYKLEYKQRDDIGDARTNWELNRHFQFPLLAKNYVASGDKKYLNEFTELFDDWVEKNPFLHGISWTSVMEIAIRCSNWCYDYVFLDHAGVEEELLEKIRVGIINMTDYVVNHYSRYSSANNHLIVEAFAIGQSGILFDHQEWVDLAIELLARELPLQNYADGINKELSLHYQSFYLEAMGLMMRLMVKNNIEVPASWESMLRKMCRYVADCIGKHGEVVSFGDDDEGKVLDLQGGEVNYYCYVLQLLGIQMGEKYVDGEISETVRWLFNNEDIIKYEKAFKYKQDQYSVYKEGGNSILRSQDREVLIGVDHAALGFGSIAAHGHADALSVQLFYKGKLIFADPGTYIYHCYQEDRNEFRKTKNHNTVCIDDRDQSEMLGAFLWGRKANAKLISYKEKIGGIRLIMEHDGYMPNIHQRIIDFDGNRNLRIIDRVNPGSRSVSHYLLAPNIRSVIKNDHIILYFQDEVIAEIKCSGGGAINSYHEYSEKYGIKEVTTGIEIGFSDECSLEINLK